MDSHFAKKIQTGVTVLVSLFFCWSTVQADEALNIELVHRTACPFSLVQAAPLLFDVRQEIILYGDEDVIERFVQNDEAGFSATGMFLCNPRERMLSLAFNNEFALVGFADGLGALDIDEDTPQLIRKFNDGRSHHKVVVEGNLAVTISKEFPDGETNQIRIYNIEDPEDIVFLSAIDGDYRYFDLENGLLATTIIGDSIKIYNVNDPENPRFDSLLPLDRWRNPRISWCDEILAVFSRIDRNAGINLFDFEDPEEPVELPVLADGVEISYIEGRGNQIVFQTIDREWGKAIYLFDIEDPEDPQQLRRLITGDWEEPERRDEYYYDGIHHGRFIEDGFIFLIEGVPHSIHRLVPDGDDSFAFTHRYYPPFKADYFIQREDRLAFMDYTKTIAATIDDGGRLNFAYRPLWCFWNYFNRNKEITAGENWLAQNGFGDFGVNYLHLFRWGEDVPILWYHSQGFPGRYNGFMLSVDNRLAVSDANTWGFFNLDEDGEPEFIGRTQQPLSGGSVFRDGFLYCTNDGIFRVFEIGDLPDMDLIAEVEADGERVFLHGDAAFLTGENGIFTVDIAAPDDPEPLGLYAIDHGARQLVFAGETAFATTPVGLLALDIDDPDNIIQSGYYHPDQDVGDYPENGGFGGIAIIGDLLYTSGISTSRSPKGLYVLRPGAGSAQQDILCRERWSIVSSHIEPSEAALEEVFAAANQREILRLCKDANGRFYSPPDNFNNIGDWDVTQAYWVAMEADHTLNMEGEPVPPDRAIPLQETWNGVAYFPRVEVEAEAAFAGIEEALIIAKDDDGNFYYPEQEFSNMAPLRPGRGYQVKVREEVELVWTVEEREDRIMAHREPLSPEHFTFRSRTGGNMSILIDSDDPMHGEVGVFAGDMCIGGVMLEGMPPYGIAVWEDDPLTSEVDGALQGDKLDLRWFNVDGSEIALKKETLVGEMVYECDGFTILSIDPFDKYPVDFGLIKAYPNPFNSLLRLSFDLNDIADVNVTIYDLAGRELTKLLEKRLIAGRHKIQIDAANWSSGIYLARLQARSATRLVKLVCIK